MRSPRQTLATVAKVAIPLAIIAFLLYRVEPEQWETLSSHPKNYPLLVAALLVALGAIGLSFSRWCLLVRCQGIELTMLEAHRISAICFLLNFVSAGSVGGDLFKAIFLAKRRPGRRVQAVASVFVDRGVGLYGLLLIASAAFLMHPGATDGEGSEALRGMSAGGLDVRTVSVDGDGTDQPAAALDPQRLEQMKWLAALLVAGGTMLLAGLVVGGRFVDALVTRGSRLPLVGGLVGKVGPPLRMFHDHPVAFGVSVLMSVGVHALLTVSVYLIARSLYPSVPTLAEHFIIVPIGMLASALPLTPAGIGVFEAAMEWLYQLIPARQTAASGTLIALVFELVKVVIAILGTIFYWTAGAEVRESLEAAEQLGGGELA